MQVFKRTGNRACSKCRVAAPYWVDLRPDEFTASGCYNLPCGHSFYDEPPLARPLLAAALLMADL